MLTFPVTICGLEFFGIFVGCSGERNSYAIVYIAPEMGTVTYVSAAHLGDLLSYPVFLPAYERQINLFVCVVASSAHKHDQLVPYGIMSSYSPPSLCAG